MYIYIYVFFLSIQQPMGWDSLQCHQTWEIIFGRFLNMGFFQHSMFDDRRVYEGTYDYEGNPARNYGRCLVHDHHFGRI